MKKLIFLPFLLISVFLFTSCIEDNSINQGGDADVDVENITLRSTGWVPMQNNVERWYQEWEFPRITSSVDEFGAVLCYYLNEFDSWEALPKSSMLFTEDGVVYNEEIFFSYRPRNLTIDYRNSHPTNPQPPRYDILLKVVIIDEDFWNSNTGFVGVNLNDYEQVKDALNLPDDHTIE